MKLKLDKIKSFLGKAPRFLARNPFLTLLFFIFLTFILGGIVFYKFCYLAEKTEPQAIEKPLSLKEDTFETILKEWKDREDNILEIEYQEYPNPFQRPVSELTD